MPTSTAPGPYSDTTAAASVLFPAPGAPTMPTTTRGRLAANRRIRPANSVGSAGAVAGPTGSVIRRRRSAPS